MPSSCVQHGSNCTAGEACTSPRAEFLYCHTCERSLDDCAAVCIHIPAGHAVTAAGLVPPGWIARVASAD